MTEQHLWHAFADMAHVAGREVTLVSGEGSWVSDDQGRRYLGGSQLNYVAASGEVNHVTVSLGSDGVYTITDTGAAISPGNGCTANGD